MNLTMMKVTFAIYEVCDLWSFQAIWALYSSIAMAHTQFSTPLHSKLFHAGAMCHANHFMQMSLQIYFMQPFSCKFIPFRSSSCKHSLYSSSAAHIPCTVISYRKPLYNTEYLKTLFHHINSYNINDIFISICVKQANLSTTIACNATL